MNPEIVVSMPCGVRPWLWHSIDLLRMLDLLLAGGRGLCWAWAGGRGLRTEGGFGQVSSRGGAELGRIAHRRSRAPHPPARGCRPLRSPIDPRRCHSPPWSRQPARAGPLPNGTPQGLMRRRRAGAPRANTVSSVVGPDVGGCERWAHGRGPRAAQPESKHIGCVRGARCASQLLLLPHRCPWRPPGSSALRPFLGASSSVSSLRQASAKHPQRQPRSRRRKPRHRTQHMWRAMC